MKKSLLMLSVILVLSGCAGSTNSKRVKMADIDFDNVVTPEGEKLYCKKEMITGTHRKTMTCLTKAEMESISRNSDFFMMKMGSTPQVGEGGG